MEINQEASERVYDWDEVRDLVPSLQIAKKWVAAGQVDPADGDPKVVAAHLKAFAFWLR